MAAKRLQIEHFRGSYTGNDYAQRGYTGWTPNPSHKSGPGGGWNRPGTVARPSGAACDMTNSRPPRDDASERPSDYYDLSPECAVAASDCASFMASRDLRYRGGTLDRCGCEGPHLATCPLREADHGRS